MHTLVSHIPIGVPSGQEDPNWLQTTKDALLKLFLNSSHANPVSIGWKNRPLWGGKIPVSRTVSACAAQDGAMLVPCMSTDSSDLGAVWKSDLI